MLDFLYLLADVAADLHRIGAGLLGDTHAHTFAAVDLLVQREVLDGIAHSSHILHEHLLPGRSGGHHYILYLAAEYIFAAYLQVVLLFGHLHHAAAHVHVVGAHRGADGLHGDAEGVQLVLVNVYIDIPLGGARHRDVTYAVHAVELGHDHVVHNLVQPGVTVVGGHGIHDYRRRGGVELENVGVGTAGGEIVLEHIHIRADIVHGLVHLRPPLHLKQHGGVVILGGGCEALKVIHGVEAVLHKFGHIGLYLRGARAGISGHHRNVRRVHLGKAVHRQLQKRKHADNHHRHIHQYGGYGIVNRRFVYTHR